MEKITFTLDGQKVSVDPGTTILEAAEAQGKTIPTFCHAKQLKPFASCFVCVVEVEGRPNLIPSCSTVVVEGMVIKSSSDRVQKARKTCVDLLLSDHLGDCLGPCMSSCPAGIGSQVASLPDCIVTVSVVVPDIPSSALPGHPWNSIW